MLFFFLNYNEVFFFILQGPQGADGVRGESGDTGPPVSLNILKNKHFCNQNKFQLQAVSRKVFFLLQLLIWQKKHEPSQCSCGSATISVVS